jgi:hypothetical protein
MCSSRSFCGVIDTVLHSACQLCCRDVTSSREDFHCQEDISEEALTARMRRLLEPFLLRRLKEQVASQLVPKQQQVCTEVFTHSHTAVDSQHAGLAPGLCTMPRNISQPCGCQTHCVTIVLRSGGWQ